MRPSTAASATVVSCTFSCGGGWPAVLFSASRTSSGSQVTVAGSSSARGPVIIRPPYYVTRLLSLSAAKPVAARLMPTAPRDLDNTTPCLASRHRASTPLHHDHDRSPRNPRIHLPGVVLQLLIRFLLISRRPNPSIPQSWFPSTGTSSARLCSLFVIMELPQRRPELEASRRSSKASPHRE